jgi:hypothetical protein
VPKNVTPNGRTIVAVWSSPVMPVFVTPAKQAWASVPVRQ